LVGRSAYAEGATPRATLEVTRGTGTESCIESDTLERAVESRLQRSVFGGGDVRVSLHFERRQRAFTAELVLFDRHGTALGRRELKTQAAHCSALDDSLALVVALLVDSPEAREQAAAAAPATTGESTDGVVPKAPSEPPRVSVTIPPDVLAPREPFRVVVGGSFAALVGPLPGVALGPELLLAVRPPHFIELRLRPSYFPEREVSAPAPDRGGRLSLVQVALDLCPLEHDFPRVRLSGCLGQSVGWVRGEGFGYLHNSETGSLVYSLGVGASALLALAGPLGVSFGLGAALPLERDSYVSQAADGVTTEVFRSAPVTGMLAVGLALEL
jgi:hypothetical protein